MKITFGRKFLGCCIATVLIGSIFGLALGFANSAITPAVVIALSGFVVTVWFAYIGGNVWNKYIQGKSNGG